MHLPDLLNVFQWWITLFFVGIIFIPITNLIFSNFFDRGYIFAKIIGIAFISYTVFILSFFKILPFETQNIFLTVGIFILINLFILKKVPLSNIKIKSLLPIFILDEFIFILILLFWSFIHAHQPEIHGLEKYMDFGFINSILRAEYFPPKDMWLTPFSINYYYFGHLVAAVLTKLSLLSSVMTFNLMLSAVAALSFVSAFSIGANLIHFLYKNGKRLQISIIGGFITAFILNFTGNLHTVYLFFKPYSNESPVPFWQLIFSPLTFPNNYWYPNATRFIENTIHEFPLYSSVVSDLHGHVLDIPFVLLTIAVLLSFFYRHVILTLSETNGKNPRLPTPGTGGQVDPSFRQVRLGLVQNDIMMVMLISFLLAIMYMTNAWDGIIYFLLTIFVFCYLIFKNTKSKIDDYLEKLKTLGLYILIIGLGFIIFTTPFNLNFKPFASGIGMLCAPKFLTDIGNFGPFLFEANHCQHSPLWQLFILYGFFYFLVFGFLFLKIKGWDLIRNWKLEIGNFSPSDIFVLILILLSTLLIIIPEFIYVKDIYPAHYRANTMFKLVYQSFIMLSIASAYISVRLILNIKNQISKMLASLKLRRSGQIKNKIFKFYYAYVLFAILFSILVFMYPYFAVNSYFGNLKSYQGLDGIKYLKSLYPTDYEAILWINKNIKGQLVILEAQGDSYTDYGRVSTNTGLPTVLGWAVHEWLWRGSYDIPSPRIAEVEKMYQSKVTSETKSLLKKYKVEFVFIGDLEKQKYPNLNEEKFKSLGKIIYQKGDTKIFKIH